MRRRLALFLLSLLAPALALGDATQERSDWDLSVKFGVTLGSIARNQTIVTNPDSSQTVTDGRSLDFGGFPLGLAVNVDLNRTLTMAVEIHFIADIQNSQISETGLALSLAYHLFGGSRRTTKDFTYATVIERERYNISLLGRFGYSHFGLSDKTGSSNNNFDGSAFEPCGGIQYRQDISERSAIAFEVYYTLTSLPASNSRIFSKRVEGVFSYRFFL